MHLIVIIVGFLLGGFVGITIMAALSIAGREEDKMKKNYTLFAGEKTEKYVRANYAQDYKI